MTPGKPYVGAQVWFDKEKTFYYTVTKVMENEFIYRWGSNEDVAPNKWFLEHGEVPKYSTTDILKALKDEITRTGN